MAEALTSKCSHHPCQSTFIKVDRGADFHVAVDGNFHHRHRRSAGDSPSFYDPLLFISKEEVDAVGHCIELQRARAPKSYSPKVPDEAVDDCEKSYTATDGPILGQKCA